MFSSIIIIINIERNQRRRNSTVEYRFSPIGSPHKNTRNIYFCRTIYICRTIYFCNPGDLSISLSQCGINQIATKIFQSFIEKITIFCGIYLWKYFFSQVSVFEPWRVLNARLENGLWKRGVTKEQVNNHD